MTVDDFKKLCHRDQVYVALHELEHAGFTTQEHYTPLQMYLMEEQRKRAEKLRRLAYLLMSEPDPRLQFVGQVLNKAK